MRFIVTVGLPGSGKSTWADQQILAAPAGDVVRVNRDAIRTMLHAGRWKGAKTEKITVQARDMLLSLAMTRGVPIVISDDTNLAPSVQQELELLAIQHNYTFVVKDFTDIPLHICIERDLKRLASVGEAVIRGMHRSFLTPPPAAAPAYDQKLPWAVLCDVDGTLAQFVDRGPYDWARVSEDVPIEPIVDLIYAMRGCDYRIIFVSGRDGSCYAATEAWLVEHVFKGEDEPLFMRPAGDRRKDAIVKEEIYRREIEGKYNVAWVVDDRAQVVEMWRGLGLTCLQVAPGEF